MFHITGFTDQPIFLATLVTLAHCVTTETTVVTHSNAGPSCSLDYLPDEINGCVNHEPNLEVNEKAVRNGFPTECAIMYQNISKVFYCKNKRWVVQTDNSNIGMGHENSKFNRKIKRFVVDGGSFESISVIGLILDQNECHCKWGQWQSWSSCTTSCLGIGGIQTRRRTLYHDSRSECFRADACSYSHLDNQSIVCNSMCYPDGTILIGGNYPNIQIYRQLPCSCPRGTIGTPGACCQAITCGTPSAISHGSFSGSLFTYGYRIQYSCDRGYNLNDRSLSVRTCTEYGIWSGRLPTCVYDACSINPCRNGAACVKRNDGYYCSCGLFWAGTNCEIDIQPPVVSGCPANRFIHVSNKTSVQTWHEPTFHDPRGNNVVVTKNYPSSSYEFPWGIYTVQYTAVKPSNGFSAECTFQITIHPHPCPKLPVPRHGLTSCNGWQTDYAKVCKVYCLEGYSLPPLDKPNLIFSCGSSGSWRPAIQVQECIQLGTFVTKKMPTFRECSLSNDDIRLQYITDLKHSQFNSLCVNNEEECTMNNVNISCTLP